MAAPSFKTLVCLALVLGLAACGNKPLSLALTIIDADRMELVRVDPDAPLQVATAEKDKAEEEASYKVVAPFAFEPHWNPARTQIAFTRVQLAATSQRILGIYKVEEDKVFDVAVMVPKDWTGYGFSPAWSPRGDALAFKLRNQDENGVYVLSLADAKVSHILPDSVGEIGEVFWLEKGIFFEVRGQGPQSPPSRIRWLAVPKVAELVGADPVTLAGESIDLGPGIEPRFYKESLYYLRPSKPGTTVFDLVRTALVGDDPEIVLRGVGPYFEIGPDGTIAYQSDPSGGTRPVRLTILRPGEKEGTVTRISAFRFRFSPDGKRLACLWLVGGKPGYFIYDHRSGEIWAHGALRGDFTAEALAGMVDRPLFDW